MAEQILMIALSPTMEVGTIIKWSKKEGDAVKTGDVICEVETDKATMEYESSQSGTILKIVTGDQSEVKVGDVIAIIGAKGESFDDLLPKAGKKAAPSPEPKSKETAKETAAAATQPVEVEKPSPKQEEAPATLVASNGHFRSSPLARKIAESRGVDLSQVTGSGPEGRIIKRDIENFKAPLGQPGMGFQSSVASNQKIVLSGKRKVIAQRLAESKFSAPHFYLKLSIMMDQVMNARSQHNAKSKEKLGLNAFLIKFVAEALKKHPVVNSSWQGDHILQFGSVDIGVAVAQPDGLVTPIVRNAGNKNIRQINDELNQLIDKARQNKLKPDEYTGATFTISSLGSFGIEEFTAIINPPGAAILAIGEIKKAAEFHDDDTFTVVQKMKVSLSCDHRVIDGAVGANFLNDLKTMMENPISVLI